MLGSLFPFDDYEAFLSLLHSLLRNPHHLLSGAENGETAYVSVSTYKKVEKSQLISGFALASESLKKYLKV